MQGQFDSRAVEMWKDVIGATNYLHNVVIPEYAQRFEESNFAAEYCCFISGAPFYLSDLYSLRL